MEGFKERLGEEYKHQRLKVNEKRDSEMLLAIIEGGVIAGLTELVEIS